jgi:nitric oxide dioxygenase
MPVQLTPDTIAIVKATVPALRAHGLDITLRMYEHLFKTEEIRSLFNQSHQGATGSQPKALALAVLAYAENIDNLGALGPAVERIAQKHVSLYILPEHYPFVATALLQAIRDILGEAATDEILAAWGEAYWFLAEILIGREAEIYRDLAAAPGGWLGWRDFRIERVEQESAVIRSFYLRPVDGGPVIRHKPGQYLTLWIDPAGGAPLKRNYTVSCAPNDEFYRISVKREAAPAGLADVPAGAASTWLHDHAKVGTILKVAPPAGDFFLDEAAARPVVLVSGGVGLTPMISMLETIVAKRPDLPTWYVHGALNREVHAMKDHVRDLAARSPNVDVKVFYAEGGEAAGGAADGVITAEWLAQNTPHAEATYFLCGPKPFLRDLAGGLMRQGVAGDRIRYEFFGPPDDLLAA